MGTIRHKRSKNNDDAANKATKQPTTLENESIPGAAIFTAATATAAASATAPGARFLS